MDLEDAADVMSFAHIAKRPLYTLSCADRFFENPSESIMQITKKAKTLLDVLMYVSLFRLKYDPITDQRKEIRNELKTRERKDFPLLPSQKLIRRKAMLERDSVPYLALSPEEDISAHRKKLEEMLAVTGKVIARSAGIEDIMGMPTRGYFDSHPNLDDLDKVSHAVADIRSMKNPYLANFLLFHGLKKPPVPHVIIEPYHDNKFSGTILEHPTFPGIFLIEYTWQDKVDRVNAAFLYDSKNDRLISSEKNVVDNEALARQLLYLYRRNKDTFPGEVSSQMEFCFSYLEDIHDLQFVDFKPYEISGEFELRRNMLFGRCNEEKLAVVYPYSIEQMVIVSRLAKEEGYKLCVVVDHRQIDTQKKGSEEERVKDRFHLASFPDNIGLAITTEGLLLQGHGYFNLLAAADNVLCLNDGAQLDELCLRPGQILTYSSDGIRYTMQKHDDTDEMMREVRRIINTSS
jgi:hypothetical protein